MTKSSIRRSTIHPMDQIQYSDRESRDKTRSGTKLVSSTRDRAAHSQIPRTSSPVSCRKRPSSIVIAPNTVRSSGAVTKASTSQPISRPITMAEKNLKVLYGIHRTMMSVDSKLTALSNQSTENTKIISELQSQLTDIKNEVQSNTPKVEELVSEVKRLGKNFKFNILFIFLIKSYLTFNFKY